MASCFLMVFLLQPKLIGAGWGGVGWGGVKATGNLQLPWAAGLAGPSLTTVELISTLGFLPCLRLGSSQGTCPKVGSVYMRVVHHPWQGRSPECSGVALSSSVSILHV